MRRAEGQKIWRAEMIQFIAWMEGMDVGWMMDVDG